MKGRINISGGGMSLNADIKEFKVADGCNIVAGDFVSRKIVPEIQELYGSDVSVYGGDRIGDNLYLFRIGDYLRIVEYSGGQARIIYTYSAQMYSQFSIDKASDVIWALNKQTTSIDRFEVSKSKLVYVDSLIIESTSTDVLAIYANENILSVLYTYYKSYDSYGLIVEKYYIEGTGLVSDETARREIYNDLRNNTKEVLSIHGGRVYFAAYGNWTYRISTGTYTYDTYYLNSGYIYKVDLSQDIEDVSLKTIDCIHDGGAKGTINAPTSKYTISSVAEIDENNVLIMYYAKIDSTIQNTALYHFNLEANTHT